MRGQFRLDSPSRDGVADACGRFAMDSARRTGPSGARSFVDLLGAR